MSGRAQEPATRAKPGIGRRPFSSFAILGARCPKKHKLLNYQIRPTGQTRMPPRCARTTCLISKEAREVGAPLASFPDQATVLLSVLGALAADASAAAAFAQLAKSGSSTIYAYSGTARLISQKSRKPTLDGQLPIPGLASMFGASVRSWLAARMFPDRSYFCAITQLAYMLSWLVLNPIPTLHAPRMGRPQASNPANKEANS